MRTIFACLRVKQCFPVRDARQHPHPENYTIFVGTRLESEQLRKVPVLSKISNQFYHGNINYTL